MATIVGERPCDIGRVSYLLCRDADRLEAFEVAIKHAVAARTPDAPRATREEVSGSDTQEWLHSGMEYCHHPAKSS